MSGSQYQTIIELLDFEIYRKDMIVHGAILKNQNEPYTPMS